jgi:hypothetical protein
MTALMPPPTGDLPDETQPFDIDALRKATVRHLLDLADEHNLTWPREVFTNLFEFGGQRVSLSLQLDDDELDAQAAWAQVLGLAPQPDAGLLTSEPYVSRTSRSHGALPGFWSVEACTFLHPARGLPEQGPRPAEPKPIVAAAPTPDAPELDAEYDGADPDTMALQRVPAEHDEPGTHVFADPPTEVLDTEDEPKPNEWRICPDCDDHIYPGEPVPAEANGRCAICAVKNHQGAAEVSA